MRAFKVEELNLLETIELLEALDLRELRSVDRNELLDVVSTRAMDITDERTIKTNLKIGFGCLSLDGNTVLVKFFHEEKKEWRPAFLARSTPSTTEGHRSLVGFAWKEADVYLNKRRKVEVAHIVVETLMLSDKEANHWTCHVSNSNKPTLDTWKYIGAKFDNLKTLFTSSPYMPNYTLVGIHYVL